MRTISYALQGCIQVQMMHEDFAQDPPISGTPGNSISPLHRMRHNEERGGMSRWVTNAVFTRQTCVFVGLTVLFGRLWSAASLVSLCFRSPLAEYVFAWFHILRDTCNIVTLNATIRFGPF
jgi:hypothetical protein